MLAKARYPITLPTCEYSCSSDQPSALPTKLRRRYEIKDNAAVTRQCNALATSNRSTKGTCRPNPSALRHQNMSAQGSAKAQPAVEAEMLRNRHLNVYGTMLCPYDRLVSTTMKGLLVTPVTAVGRHVRLIYSHAYAAASLKPSSHFVDGSDFSRLSRR